MCNHNLSRVTMSEHGQGTRRKDVPTTGAVMSAAELKAAAAAHREEEAAAQAIRTCQDADLSMDGEVLDHVQVKLLRLGYLSYFFSTGITVTRMPGNSPRQPGARGSSVSQAGTPLSPDRTIQLLPGSGSRSVSKPPVPTVTGSCSRNQLGPFQEDGIVLPTVSSPAHPSDGNGDGKPHEDSVSK